MTSQPSTETIRKKIALFPGQGSQYVGMGKDLFDNFKTARTLFEEASDAIKRDLKKLCFEGPELDLVCDLRGRAVERQYQPARNRTGIRHNRNRHDQRRDHRPVHRGRPPRPVWIPSLSSPAE